MQQSVNRVRAIRSGCHCAQCSPWIIYVAGGVIWRRLNRGASRPGGAHRYTDRKSKHQSAYRRRAPLGDSLYGR